MKSLHLSADEKLARKRASSRRWNQLHKDHVYAKNLEWREKNRDRWLELKRQYHKRARAKETKEQKVARLLHKNKVDRKRYEKNPIVLMLNVAKKRAKQSGREFSLTKEWALSRWTGKCEITGAAFILERGRANAFAPSLDRIDSSRGYTQDNCRFVLWAVNRFKGDESDEVMRQIARLVVGH